jgi:hypothetical protein
VAVDIAATSSSGALPTRQAPMVPRSDAGDRRRQDRSPQSPDCSRIDDHAVVTGLPQIRWPRCVDGRCSRPAADRTPQVGVAAQAARVECCSEIMIRVVLPAPAWRPIILAHGSPDRSRPSPGRPRSTIDRRRQTLKPQRAGQQRFDGQRPSSRSASITSTTSGGAATRPRASLTAAAASLRLGATPCGLSEPPG